GRIVLADDELAWVAADELHLRPELLDQGIEPRRVISERGEDRHAPEVVDDGMLAVGALEDVAVAPAPLHHVEDVPQELQHLAVPGRADRRRARVVIQAGHLAEQLAGADPSDGPARAGRTRRVARAAPQPIQPAGAADCRSIRTGRLEEDLDRP